MKITAKLQNFGILVIRTIWPGKSVKGAARLGAVLLGIGVLIGVGKASGIDTLISGVFGGSANTRKAANLVKTDDKIGAVSMPSAARKPNAPKGDDETTSSKVTIVELISESETIIVGNVESVTDGIENGVPYTEVTMVVNETLKGAERETMTFRQFGLLKPRQMEDGRMNLMVTPDGWATYSEGDESLVFLHASAKLTGLRAPIGLGQGKFDLKTGNLMNQTGNIGLFQDVTLSDDVETDRDSRLLVTEKGPVSAESLTSFVKRAVTAGWIEGGKLRHVKN